MSEASRRRLFHILYPNKQYQEKIDMTNYNEPYDIADPNATVTRAEMYRGLREHMSSQYPVDFKGYFSLKALVNDVVNKANKNGIYSPRSSTPNPRADETVTFAELSAALKRLRFADFTTDSHVTQMFDDIKAHRENFQGGDIVMTPAGGSFARLLSPIPSRAWKNLYTNGVVSEDTPLRPLKKVGRTDS